jgi:hypothetical protein
MLYRPEARFRKIRAKLFPLVSGVLVLSGCGGAGQVAIAPAVAPAAAAASPDVTPLASPKVPTVDASAPRIKSRDFYPAARANPVKVAAETPVSSFPVSVDTASYAVLRRHLEEGALPPPDAVRTEEVINYFDYGYADPEHRQRPFLPTIAVYPTPWNSATRILHIGIKGLGVSKVEPSLQTIARDVKLQIEFNPAHVAEYRLIGYESRPGDRSDLNPKTPAANVGSGHTVTALYEIRPVGSSAPLSDPVRYGARAVAGETNGEIAFLKIRYKLPDEDVSRLILRPVTVADVHAALTDVPEELRFAAAVAGAAQLLRRDPYIQSFDYAKAIMLADAAKGIDGSGRRAEFVQLLKLAESAAALKPLDHSAIGAVP